MKYTYKMIVIGILMVALTFGTVAMAEVDLSGMSYDELVELKDRINKAIWDSEEWQEVTVPQGIYQVGEDIPAGHWTIEACDGVLSQIIIGSWLKDNGKEVLYSSKNTRYFSISLKSPTAYTYKEGSDISFFDFTFIEGDYVEIRNGDAIFTPYSGKASLGFK